MTAPAPTSSKTGLGAQITAAVIGLAFLGVGIFLLIREVETPPTHNAHVYTFAGMMAFGALLIVPGPVVAALKSVSPFLPKFGPFGGDR